jgi:hypothetical protein
MRTTTIEVDEHDACALAHAASEQLTKAKGELGLLFRFKDGDAQVLRCYLPKTLFNLSREEIVEQIDPWISLVHFWEHWHEVFSKAAERETK